MTDESKLIVHIDATEVRAEILDYQIQDCPACGTQLEDGFGLAGGGFGPYGYCTKCQRVIYKINMPDDWS